MLNTFSQVFKRHVRSVSDFERDYDNANELLKQVFGAEYDLELFKLSGETIFSKTVARQHSKVITNTFTEPERLSKKSSARYRGFVASR